MPKFLPLNYQQNTMVVINYLDQLQPGTFEHAIHHLIDTKLDISVFYPRYKNDDNGRPAYDPAALLKIILFAYSKGITSSREIQWCCETNIIFKALSCDSAPHFTTIAAFVSGRKDEIEAVFEQVLLICHEQGLLGNELFAIDGCKMPSNASKEWSGTFKELEAKRAKLKRQIRYHMTEHEKLDKSEAAEEVRQQRAEQAIETLNNAHDKIDQFLKTHNPRMGKGKRIKEVKSNITDNESAKMTTSKGTIQGYNGVATVDRKHQIIIDAQAFGEGQEHHTLKPVLERIKRRYQELGISEDIYQSNTIVTADTGFANEANMQYLHEEGINGYIPDNQFRSRDPKFDEQKQKYGKRHQGNKARKAALIPASEFHFDPIKCTCVCPAGESMWLHYERIEPNGKKRICFEGRLSKCRSCALKTKCLRNPNSPNDRKGHGRQVTFVAETKRTPTFTDWMKHRVDSPLGKHIYSHRMSAVEPVFGNIGTNKRLSRFNLRGKDKVQSQWQLFCLIHNLEKLHHYGQPKVKNRPGSPPLNATHTSTRARLTPDRAKPPNQLHYTKNPDKVVPYKELSRRRASRSEPGFSTASLGAIHGSDNCCGRDSDDSRNDILPACYSKVVRNREIRKTVLDCTQYLSRFVPRCISNAYEPECRDTDCATCV